jgi:hypothetical protein
MRFEAQSYVATGTEAPELSRFLTHYNFVTKFLLQFNQNRFKLGTDVKIDTLSVNIQHNQPTTISHTCGKTDNIIVQGRVELYTINVARDNEISITAKLLTSPIAHHIPQVVTDRITVVDPSLFRTGDRIRIGETVRSLVGISGNTLVLESPVVYDEVYVVSLATETAKVIIF